MPRLRHARLLVHLFSLVHAATDLAGTEVIPLCVVPGKAQACPVPQPGLLALLANLKLTFIHSGLPSGRLQGMTQHMLNCLLHLCA